MHSLKRGFSRGDRGFKGKVFAKNEALRWALKDGPSGVCRKFISQKLQPGVGKRIYLPLRAAKGKTALNAKGNFKRSTFRGW